jgi:hypothetical protein
LKTLIFSFVVLASCKGNQDNSVIKNVKYCRPPSRPKPLGSSVLPVGSARPSSVAARRGKLSYPNIKRWADKNKRSVNTEIYKILETHWSKNAATAIPSVAANLPKFRGDVFSLGPKSDLKLYKKGSVISFDNVVSGSSAKVGLKGSSSLKDDNTILNISAQSGVPVRNTSFAAFKDEVLFQKHETFLVEDVVTSPHSNKLSEEYKKALENAEIEGVVYLTQLSKSSTVRMRAKAVVASPLVNTTKMSLSNPLHSASNYTRYKALLGFMESNILTPDSRLTKEAIGKSFAIMNGEKLKNPAVIRELSKDGYPLKDWAKYTTQSIVGKKGEKLQIHYYYNKKKKVVNYNIDFKIKEEVQL